MLFCKMKLIKLNYKFYKKRMKLNFNTKLKILKNPFKIDLLNYKKIKILI